IGKSLPVGEVLARLTSTGYRYPFQFLMICIQSRFLRSRTLRLLFTTKLALRRSGFSKRALMLHSAKWLPTYSLLKNPGNATCWTKRGALLASTQKAHERTRYSGESWLYLVRKLSSITYLLVKRLTISTESWIPHAFRFREKLGFALEFSV